MRKQGFTLIELMIVIAIIAIIAAIAIPNLLSGRMSANEASAGAALKLITSSEAVWLQQDADGNGIKDYWTYDVSCLHRAMRADGTTKVAFIAIDLARADRAAAPAGTFLAPVLEVANTPSAKSGYWFRALATDPAIVPPAIGAPNYNSNPVGGVAAGNNSRYGFWADPDVYGTSGINIFIVNQEGTIYATDPAADPNNITAWPGPNPPSLDGPCGRKWRVAD